MTGTTGKIERSTLLALVAMALGVFVIANDFTALSVAIPEIEHDLSTTLNSAQWVINGYALVFGVLIVTGGRLADLFGRKRIFMIGAALLRRLLARGRPHAERRTADPLPRAHGHRWCADVAGDPRDDLRAAPCREGGVGRRLDHRRRRRRQRGRAPVGRLPHRRVELALGVLHQRARHRVRGVGHVPRWCQRALSTRPSATSTTPGSRSCRSGSCRSCSRSTRAPKTASVTPRSSPSSLLAR